MQMVVRKRIMIWNSKESKGMTGNVKKTKVHTEKIPLSLRFPQYSLSSDEFGEVVTGLLHCKHSSPMQLKE